MGCKNCAELSTETTFHSPPEALHFVAQLKQAVRNNVLQYNSFQSDREVPGQTTFMEIANFYGKLPRTMVHHFDCRECGNVYTLRDEGSSGNNVRWYRAGNLKR